MAVFWACFLLNCLFGLAPCWSFSQEPLFTTGCLWADVSRQAECLKFGLPLHKQNLPCWGQITFPASRLSACGWVVCHVYTRPVRPPSLASARRRGRCLCKGNYRWHFRCIMTTAGFLSYNPAATKTRTQPGNIWLAQVQSDTVEIVNHAEISVRNSLMLLLLVGSLCDNNQLQQSAQQSNPTPSLWPRHSGINLLIIFILTKITKCGNYKLKSWRKRRIKDWKCQIRAHHSDLVQHANK